MIASSTVKNVRGVAWHAVRTTEVAMPSSTLDRRVKILENKLDVLNQLPERTGAVESRLGVIETELIALRAEMRTEFSAVRNDIRTGDEETRRQMRVLHEDVISRISLLQDGLKKSNRCDRR